MANLANQLQELHLKGFAHNDVSAQNVYLDEDLQPILGDFGKARLVNARNITDDWIQFLEMLYLLLGEAQHRTNPEIIVYKPFQIYNHLVSAAEVGLSWQESRYKDAMMMIVQFMTHSEVTYQDIEKLLSLLVENSS